MDNLDYGIIGNCRSAALISKTGSIDWCCLPEFDSSSIFAKILDEEIGGSFEIIVSEDYRINQRYKKTRRYSSQNLPTGPMPLSCTILCRGITMKMAAIILHLNWYATFGILKGNQSSRYITTLNWNMRWERQRPM